MLTVVPGDGSGHEAGKDGSASLIDEIVREGARRMLAEALQAEVDAYIARFADERDDNGRRLVVRNGSHQPREILTSAGAVEVTVPRVNDKRTDPDTGERKRFSSAIVPPWARKTPKITEVLPLLYLHGLSSGDFVPALGQFLGSSAGLSAAVITRLTETWKAEQHAFAARDLSGADYVYLWADGIHVNIRLEEHKLCLLVMIGVRADGRKELIALADGYRESAESWADLLRDCARRGMRAPVLAVGDGALGFWNALREVFPETREGRCWFHRGLKESTWRFRCGLAVCVSCGGVEERGGGGIPRRGSGDRASVLVQQGADPCGGVAYGAPAYLEQLRYGLPAADFAQAEDDRQDTFCVGDFLGEDAAAGSGEPVTAPALVFAAFGLGSLPQGQPLDQGRQVLPAHPGQCRIAQRRQPVRPGGRDPGGREVPECARAGEPQDGRRDRVPALG